VFKLHFEGKGSLAIGDPEEFTYSLQASEVKRELAWCRHATLEKEIAERWKKFQESQPKPQVQPEPSLSGWILGSIGSTVGSFLNTLVEASENLGTDRGRDDETSRLDNTFNFNLFGSEDD